MQTLGGNGCCAVADLHHVVSCFLVRTSKNTGVMFLCEVALGKEHTITRDNHTLKKAPAGFDSVVARGSVEPGPIFLHVGIFFFLFLHKMFCECESSQVSRPDTLTTH